MAKTIEDYKKDYAAAQAKGDKKGMAAANNAANALRQQQGQKVEVADVTKEVYGNNYVGAPTTGSTSSNRVNSGSSSSNQTGMKFTSSPYVSAAPNTQQPPQNLYTSTIGGVHMIYDKQGNVYATGDEARTGYAGRNDLLQNIMSGNVNAIGSVNDYVTDQYRKQLSALQMKNPNATLQNYLTGIDLNDMGVAYTGVGSNYLTTDYGKVIQQAKEDFAEAQKRGDQSAVDQAHRMAEIVRQLHAYTGGADGSQNMMLFLNEDTILPNIGNETDREAYYNEAMQYLMNGGLYGNGIQNNLGTFTGAYNNNGAAVTLPERKALSEGVKGTLTKNGNTYYRMDQQDQNGNPIYMMPTTGKLFSGVLDDSGQLQMVQIGKTDPILQDPYWVDAGYYNQPTQTPQAQAREQVSTAQGTAQGTPMASSLSELAMMMNASDGINVWTQDQQAIKDQMMANSEAWHSATSQAEKDRLHAENQYLAGLLGGQIGFDSSTGTWSGNAGQSGSSGQGQGTITFPEFSYEKAPEYTSQWDSIIKDLANQILNRDPFSYDYTTDPSYQQYREAYTREGQRAMQDTLGEVAARTGGLASSYAASAASQANNYYMAQLADKIPELRQMAYEAYLNNLSNQRSDLSMLMGLEDSDYSKYLNALSQWNTDRNFGYNAWRDQVSDERYENEWNYKVAQDQWEKSYIAAQFLAEYGNFSGYATLFGLSDSSTQALVNAYAEQQNLSKQQAAMELADWYAQYGDFSKLNEMGVDTSYLQFIQNQEYLSAMMGGGSSGSSGSSGGGKGSSSSGKGSSSSGGTQSGSDIVSYMLSLGSDAAARQYLLGLNLSQWEYNEYLDVYEAAKNQSGGGNNGDSSLIPTQQEVFDATVEMLTGKNSGLSQLQNQLSQIQDSGDPLTVSKRAANIIRQYEERGSISEATARRLLSRYGVSY